MGLNQPPPRRSQGRAIPVRDRVKEFLELRAKARQNGGSTHSSINGNGTSIHDDAVPSTKNNGEDDLGSETNGKSGE